jgi:homoserine O-acetyltransferase
MILETLFMRRLFALPTLSIFAALALAACAQLPAQQQPAAAQAGSPAASAVLATTPVPRPAVKSATWVARDFRFHTGETLPALTIAYRTLGNPAGEPVMLLHGTTGNGSNFLGAAFADQMFGPGQPLDAARYFTILPDSIGTGDSSKPSDGLRA